MANTWYGRTRIQQRAARVDWLMAHLELVTEPGGYGAHATTPHKRALFVAMQAAGLYAPDSACVYSDLTPLIQEARQRLARAPEPSGAPLGGFTVGQAVRYQPATYGYENMQDSDGRIPAVVIGFTATRVRLRLLNPGYHRALVLVDLASVIRDPATGGSPAHG
jgi:hypothetical protein